MRTVAWVAIVSIVVAASVTVALFAAQRSPRLHELTLSTSEFGYNGPQSGPELRVRVGDTVRIRLTNAGGLGHEFMVVADKELALQMMHEIVAELQQQGMEGHALEAAYDARHEERMMDMMPIMGGQMFVARGETQVFEFQVVRGGTYWYVCLEGEGTAPELHADRGMFGRLIVEP